MERVLRTISNCPVLAVISPLGRGCRHAAESPARSIAEVAK